MPVYLRKKVSYTPPSIGNISDEDEDDYLQDPDQMRDCLPQPYRMINKVLNRILNDVWEIIEGKENKRLTEERKFKPPRYDQPEKLQMHNHATALTESEDGRYVFVGLPNGLAAMDPQNQQTLSHWEEDGAEIVSISCHTLHSTTGYYLLTTIDDMAVARLFLFACDCLFFVKNLTETEAGPKLLAHKCEASFEGDYVGVLLENTNTKEVWFEVHKLPRETWVKELETVEATLQKQREQEQKELEEKDENAVSTDQGGQPAPDDGQKQQEKDSPRPPSPPPVQPSTTGMEKKFSPCTLVVKVRPPQPYTANQASSTFSACQKVDKGDVLGTGLMHIMTAAHLDSRDTTFQYIHAGMMKYLDKDGAKKPSDVLTANFHFVNPGRTLPTGLENVGQTDRPAGVVLWWKGSCHLMQYSLLKTAKGQEQVGGKASVKSKGKSTQLTPDPNRKTDIEHKPDLVWPFSSSITASAISRCTSHIAIGLENGNVTVWDRYMGLQRGVVNMNKGSAVQMLRFLSPSLYPTVPMDYPPYPQRTGTFLLAQYRDSTQFIYDIGRTTQDQPVCISNEPECDDEVQTLLDSVPDLPEVALMVQKNGNLYLKDIQTGVLLCQLVLPETHQLSSPWDPIVTFAARGQFLFVKGAGIQTDEGEESSTTYISGMYMFNLRSYPPLDKYWTRIRTDNQLLVHPTVEQRLDTLMKERLAQQALRKSRLQMRWGMLRSDLAVIQNARETTAPPPSRPFAW